MPSKSDARIVDAEWFTFGRIVTPREGNPYLWLYDRQRFDDPVQAQRKAATFRAGAEYDVYRVREIKRTTVTRLEVE